MSRLSRLSWLLLLALALPHPALGDGPPELETFFRHAEFDSMVISPDGRYLATIAPDEDRQGLAIVDISAYPEIAVTGTIKLGRGENVSNLGWVSNNQVVFGSTRQVGRLAQPFNTGRVFTMGADGRGFRLIFGPRDADSVFVGRSAQILHPLPDDRRRILIADTTQDRTQPIAWLLDLDRYQRTSMVASSPFDNGGLHADNEGVVRFALGQDIEGRRTPKFGWRPDGNSDWRTMDNPFRGSVSFWGFTADNRAVYLKTRDPERMGVFRLELASGELSELLTDSTVEALRPVRDVDNITLIGAVFNTVPPEARFIDPEQDTARLWRSLQAALPAYHLTIGRFADDGRTASVFLFSDREPGVFMKFNSADMSLQELAPVRGWVPAERMGAQRGVRFQARDGLELHGILTLPPGVEEPDRLPMVVEVHGGPYGPYDTWGWSPWVQAMAAHGYAVLQVNFRGSGGYGHDFQFDAYSQWGLEMQDDLTDATRWAIDQGIAHPDRVCISGGSYGGYAAMNGVVREPDLYRCAFAFVGVYDLEEMRVRGNVPERLRGGMDFLDAALGTDPESLRARSPVRHVENVRADLFIAHGAEDLQAHYGQYHLLIEALERAGIPHDKLFVENEGHGFYDVDNNVELYGRALRLFERNIGPGWTPRDPAPGAGPETGPEAGEEAEEEAEEEEEARPETGEAADEAGETVEPEG